MHHSPTDASLGEANSTATTLEMARSSVPATSPLESFHYGLKVAACTPSLKRSDLAVMDLSAMAAQASKPMFRPANSCSRSTTFENELLKAYILGPNEVGHDGSLSSGDIVDSDDDMVGLDLDGDDWGVSVSGSSATYAPDAGVESTHPQGISATGIEWLLKGPSNRYKRLHRGISSTDNLSEIQSESSRSSGSSSLSSVLPMSTTLQLRPSSVPPLEGDNHVATSLRNTVLPVSKRHCYATLSSGVPSNQPGVGIARVILPVSCVQDNLCSGVGLHPLPGDTARQTIGVSGAAASSPFLPPSSNAGKPFSSNHTSQQASIKSRNFFVLPSGAMESITNGRIGEMPFATIARSSMPFVPLGLESSAPCADSWSALAGEAAGASSGGVPVLGLPHPSVARKAKEVARRTAHRKDFFVLSLKTQLVGLSEENQKLKDIAKRVLPQPVAQTLLSMCISAQPSILTDPEFDADLTYDKPTATLVHVLREAQRSYVITDPRQVDNPIVWVSPSFCELTGYNRDEILGRNCRFLQGPATDRVTVNKIRKAVDEKYPDSLCLVNYRKDGAPFWNNLYISPLFDQAHTVIHYIGVQCDVTAAYVPEGDANNAVSGSAMPSAAIPVAWRT